MWLPVWQPPATILHQGNWGSERLRNSSSGTSLWKAELDWNQVCPVLKTLCYTLSIPPTREVCLKDPLLHLASLKDPAMPGLMAYSPHLEHTCAGPPGCWALSCLLGGVQREIGRAQGLAGDKRKSNCIWTPKKGQKAVGARRGRKCSRNSRRTRHIQLEGLGQAPRKVQPWICLLKLLLRLGTLTLHRVSQTFQGLLRESSSSSHIPLANFTSTKALNTPSSAKPSAEDWNSARRWPLPHA